MKNNRTTYSLLSWGELLGVGSAFLSFMLGSLGFIVPLHLLCPALLSIFVLLFLLLAFTSRLPKIQHVSPLCLGVFTVLALLALNPSHHPDPFWYHLEAPRFWLTKNTISFNPSAIPLVQASWWEYLYLLPLSFFGEERTFLNQVSVAQELHLLIGGAGSVLMGHILLKKHYSSSSELTPSFWVVLGALCTILHPETSTSLTLAKNELGIMLWTLTGVSLLDRFPILSLFLLGMAGSGKFSYLLVIVPIIICWWYHRRKASLPEILAFLLPCIIVGGRNFLWTKNPFFPLFDFIFHSPFLGPTWRAGLSSYAHPSFFGGITHCVTLFQDNLVILFGLVAFVLLPTTRLPFFILLSSFFCFLLCAGPKAELRLIGVIPATLTAYGYLGVGLLENRYSKAWQKNTLKAISALPLLLSLQWYPEQLRPLLKKEHFSTLHPQLAGILTCLEEAQPSPGSVAFLHETSLFPFSMWHPIRIWDNPELDRYFSSVFKQERWKEVLHKYQILYVIDTPQTIDTFQNITQENLFITSLRQNGKKPLCENDYAALYEVH